ncbi:hypothetical protein BDV96DRAFT_647243 [Lophiotrema nucula]|uniref:Uncharacterized protein n=1 Tax=Lophiotrema nucula TaxID=690887 RepID=A0A6A5Z6A1_9PLEO|nr:hypothetical protein BDV96DRAFT_647243 [Lophiotrema nucula]
MRFLALVPFCTALLPTAFAVDTWLLSFHEGVNCGGSEPASFGDTVTSGGCQNIGVSVALIWAKATGHLGWNSGDGGFIITVYQHPDCKTDGSDVLVSSLQYDGQCESLGFASTGKDQQSFQSYKVQYLNSDGNLED